MYISTNGELMMIKSYIIMDGQWGSCGKGLLAGKLAMDRKPDVIVCNFGPNAGHTYINSPGAEPVITSQLPTGLVYGNSLLMIGPGSIINPEKLLAEIEKYGHYDVKNRLMIHPRAAVVTDYDLEREGAILGSISSTKKGTGSASARKMMRVNEAGNYPLVARDDERLQPWCVEESLYYDSFKGAIVQIESAQGFELSINHGSSYPYCTGRDITVESILNDVGINRFDLDEVNMVVRTNPIRVGNEYKDGELVGTSGPVYPDMEELTWEQVSERAGYKIEEKTTVTNKVRRVFTWSWVQYYRAMTHIRPDNVMLNFMNYLTPAKQYSDIEGGALEFIGRVTDGAHTYSNGGLRWIGYGPTYEDVEDLAVNPKIADENLTRLR